MMQYPLEIGLGRYAVSVHLLLETLAFMIGFRYFLYLRRHQVDRISDSNRVWIIIGAAFGAFFFSRLIGALEDPAAFAGSAHPVLFFYASKTIVGGLLGGLLVVELTKLALKETSSSGDLFTFPLILAMIIGRIGCFSSGVHEPTYGDETTSFLGMDLGDGLMRHPVSLYEIAFLFILWYALKRLEKRRMLANGYRFKLFMIAYLLFRFLLDFIKPGFTFYYGIGTIQICCIAGLIYYSKTLGYIFSRPQKLYAA